MIKLANHCYKDMEEERVEYKERMEEEGRTDYRHLPDIDGPMDGIVSGTLRLLPRVRLLHSAGMLLDYNTLRSIMSKTDLTTLFSMRLCPCRCDRAGFAHPPKAVPRPHHHAHRGGLRLDGYGAASTRIRPQQHLLEGLW